MIRILLIVLLAIFSREVAQATPIQFVFTAAQLLNAVDLATEAACGNPESQGCAFYAFQATPANGGTLSLGSSTAPDYAATYSGGSVFWSDTNLDTVVAFLTRKTRALSGTFTSLTGQSGDRTPASPNVPETAQFRVSLERTGVTYGSVESWHLIAYGVVLKTNGTEGTGKPLIAFDLSAAGEAVPEPAANVLIGSGLLAIVVAARRMKNTKRNDCQGARS